MVILIVCPFEKENKLHILEYVKPVEKIVKSKNLNFKTISYEEISSDLIEKSSKIIITGNSLKHKQSHLLKNLSWIKDYKKPFLGICAGCQILLRIHGGEKKNFPEIGLNNIEILEEDTIVNKEDLREIYSLHVIHVEVSQEFKIMGKTKIPQIVKHKNKSHYGVLFHPEVRNVKLIEKFLMLN